MSRYTEIETAAHNAYEDYLYENSQDFANGISIGFRRGAEWADKYPNLSEEEQVGMDDLGMNWQKKHFIDRSYEYLRTHLWQNADADDDPIVESVRNITLDDFIKDFKRYLEE